MLKIFLEIRDQKHLMIAEGTANNKPLKHDIKIAIFKKGFVASNIEIFYDDFQGIWRFNADILKTLTNNLK